MQNNAPIETTDNINVNQNLPNDNLNNDIQQNVPDANNLNENDPTEVNATESESKEPIDVQNNCFWNSIDSMVKMVVPIVFMCFSS